MAAASVAVIAQVGIVIPYHSHSGPAYSYARDVHNVHGVSRVFAFRETRTHGQVKAALTGAQGRTPFYFGRRNRSAITLIH